MAPCPLLSAATTSPSCPYFQPSASGSLLPCCPSQGDFLIGRPSTSHRPSIKMALWQALGGISGATSIIAGAYGAHGLASRSMPQGSPPPVTGAPLSPEQRDKVWQRAVSYQQLHSLALLLVPVLTPAGSATQLVAGASFSSGILLFSGGCYGYALTGDKSVSSMAPFGGTAFVLGWLALAIAARGRVRAPAALASKGT